MQIQRGKWIAGEQFARIRTPIVQQISFTPCISARLIVEFAQTNDKCSTMANKYSSRVMQRSRRPLDREQSGPPITATLSAVAATVVRRCTLPYPNPGAPATPMAGAHPLPGETAPARRVLHTRRHAEYNERARHRLVPRPCLISHERLLTVRRAFPPWRHRS